MIKSVVVGAALLASGGALLVSNLAVRPSEAGLQEATVGVMSPELRGAPTAIRTQRIASGLTRPTWLGSPAGDFERIFVIEKQGIIRIIKNGVLLATPFLNIDPLVTGGTSDFSEQGLLAMAFAPNYETSGVYYVHYTGAGGVTTIARYTRSADPDVSNVAADIIFTQAQPFANHNGGWMEFGPNDGLLYIGLGDGGSFCDPSNNAQNINSLLGKILRIDVNGDDFPADANRDYRIPPSNPFAGATPGADEVWQYGLRNPWRCDFDTNGDLYIGDVGQDRWEEIDFVPDGNAGGMNFGWDCMEGAHCSSDSPSSCTSVGCTCFGAGLVDPIHEYLQAGTANCSVTGGVVYRGCKIPDLRGTYFLSDFCSNQIWSFRYNGVAVSDFQTRTAALQNSIDGFFVSSIVSFGEDALGEVYIVDQGSGAGGGEIFKIVMAPGETCEDCDSNGECDPCDIVMGAADMNGNEVLDVCECPTDLDGDGQTGSSDIAILLGNWGNPGAGDFDGGGVGSSDLAVLLGAWGPCF